MKICGVITTLLASEAAGICQAFSGYLDMFEFRLDCLADHQLNDICAMISRIEKPVIATLRPQRHGGGYEGSEADRIEILNKFAEAGAALVDLENDVPEAQLRPFAKMNKLLHSYHNFESTPSELPSIARQLAESPAQILKIATQVRCLDDLLLLHQVKEELQRDPREKAMIGMGSPGVITRILGARLNSSIHYASLPGLGSSASGQLDLFAILNSYRLRSLNSGTEAYGVLGWPLDHSLSPHIHNACFAALGMNRVYVPLATPTLGGLREVSAHYQIRGFSVTLPHKTAIIPFCDELDESARYAGAVNTVVIGNGKWIGANTDVEGFLQPLQSRIPLAGLRVAVIGSGGAARGVCHGLTKEGAQVVVYSRNSKAGKSIAATFGAVWCPLDQFGEVAIDLVIQTTSVGMSPMKDNMPCSLSRLRQTNGEKPCLVYELVYNPYRTRFLTEAKGLGFQTLEGLEMFLAQAALQFQLWTGQAMPMDVARHAAIMGLESWEPIEQPPTSTRSR
jgi:3-dehydroquinate dehydratase / shikimate dehydrogenase